MTSIMIHSVKSLQVFDKEPNSNQYGEYFTQKVLITLNSGETTDITLFSDKEPSNAEASTSF